MKLRIAAENKILVHELKNINRMLILNEVGVVVTSESRVLAIIPTPGWRLVSPARKKLNDELCLIFRDFSEICLTSAFFV